MYINNIVCTIKHRAHKLIVNPKKSKPPIYTSTIQTQLIGHLSECYKKLSFMIEKVDILVFLSQSSLKQHKTLFRPQQFNSVVNMIIS